MRRTERFALIALLIVATLIAYMVPSSAQVASRMFATLSTNLTTGASTPITCTASGAGCYLDISVGGGTMTPNALCLDATNQDVCLSRSAAGTMSLSVGTTLMLPAGAAASNALGIGAVNTGFTSPSANNISMYTAGTAQWLSGSGIFRMASTTQLGWASGGADATAIDTSLKRGASATLLNIVDAAGTTGIQLNSGSGQPGFGSTQCATGTITAGSRNTAGQVTATGATSCGITFATPAWTNAPFCTMTNMTANRGNISTITTGLFTMTNLTAGDVVNWHCIGRI